MKVHDLNVFKPEPNKITVGDKTFTIKILPFIVEAQLMENLPLLTKLENKTVLKKEDIEKLLDLIFEVFRTVDNDLTMEWVKLNVNSSIFNHLFPVIYSMILPGKAKEGKESDKKKEDPEGT